MKKNVKHIFNRGINKSPIFLDNSDKKRFIESLYKLNNKGTAIRDRSQNMFKKPPKQKRLVEVLKWTLMPNHFHLLLLENEKGDITEFIKRLANSYTKYFNIKYKRSGYLFQNKTQTLLLENDQQFQYIPSYIDLSPLGLSYPDWKEIGIHNGDKAIDWLADYEWSSFHDYEKDIARDYSCIINKEKFYEIFETDIDKYRKELIKLVENPIKKV